MSEPLWTKEKVLERLDECEQSADMDALAFDMRDEYEAERTQLQARVLELTGELEQFKKNEALFRLWTRDEFNVTDEQIDDLLGIPHGYPDIMASMEAEIATKDARIAELEAQLNAEYDDPPSVSSVVIGPSITAHVMEAVTRPDFHVDYSEYESEASSVTCPAKVRVLIDGVGFKAGDILKVYSFHLFPGSSGTYELWVPLSNDMERCVGIDAKHCEPVPDEVQL